MKRLLNALALLTALALSSPTLAVAAKAFSAEYSVLRDGSPLGNATLRYQPQGSSGEFVTRTQGTAGLAALAGIDIEERSQLRWQGDVPETVSYRYRMKAAWNSRERSVLVDAAAGTITSIDKDRRYDFPYQPGVLDRHAVTLAIMQALAKGARGELVFMVADRGKFEAQRYAVSARVRLKTAIGTRPALRVERIRDSSDGKTTTIWFDRERGFLPLRILQTQDKGERLELRISAQR